ncbi:IclR family transcriptional regulator [Cryobacterium luteum]|uniref:IclR family transcriptional regulator n=1 Tax=Cryobacterium luteum TaxID=1424661 RepID=A0A1H8H6U6_9MICO|nr:IclR family transcriptional regulator [Cryobacterium luteum]TFB86759.1 IclR family transcriptional regulator [Cryobacterium luteum]SEN51724.1 transcriptional regulator, IclR family [Cryobacterium luteum]
MASKVPAAQNTLRVLMHQAAQRGPVPAATLASSLGLPRSTVYQLLDCLVAEGFVVHLPEEHRYGLGIAAFELSSGFSRQEPLSRLGRPLIAQLVDRLGESAHLVVLHGRDVIYLVEERAAHRPSLVSDVGVRLPAHLTASGRAMLAGLPAAQLRALYPSQAALEQRDGRGPRTRLELRAVLDRARTDAYATENGEITPGIASVALAVRDHAGWPAAAIAVTFANDRFDVDRWPALAAAVAVTAAELSRRIGGRPG